MNEKSNLKSAMDLIGNLWIYKQMRINKSSTYITSKL